MESSFDRLKELNLSRDEVNRIGEALKKEEFRKLLVDYVEEIQNPENRKKYEDEITEIERERGQEVTFLHPNAGYVIKTSINGTQKCFINICSNDNIKKPSSCPSIKGGARGLQWSLPHSLSPPHEDVDNKGVRCQVFDVLFHSDTLHLASKNKDFHGMVNNVALEAVESNFHVSLDKKNIKFPKISYKGMKRATIMRKPTGVEPAERSPEEKEMFDKLYAEIDSQRSKKVVSPKKTRSKNHFPDESKSCYTTPKYAMKHRSHVEMQDFTEDRHCKINAAIPKELIVEIDLPLLKCSSDMDLDVTEKTIQLISEKPAKYKLNLTLPYQVIESNGTAKFDKDLKKLVITLPVNRKNVYEPVKYDSGVESCLESDLNSPLGLESDDEDSESRENVIKSNNSKATSQNRDNFLNASDIYNLPEFSCNTFDNVLAFTFNVKNVDESTVCKDVEGSLVKVKFTSVSSSFYLSCYAFYVRFPQHEIKEEEVTVETWDNNVILQIPLNKNGVPLSSYLYGTNLDTLQEKFLEEPSIINKILQEPEPQLKVIKEDTDELKDENSALIEEVKQKPSDTKPSKYYMDDLCFQEPRSFPKRKSKAIDIHATSYESSGDELSATSFSPRKGKGILKRMSSKRANFGRSVSESSLDDFVCSSFEYYHGSIECVPEDSREDDGMSDGMSSSLKKTVRFNDVVTKQLFRSNSSILGQKKKNQRKARNKKRAHDRRFSESETSDVEGKKEGDIETVDTNTNRCGNLVLTGDNDKKDDHDIFHLEINN